MARPRLKIDLDQVEKLAAINCTNTEIAAVLGCDSSLLSKPRFSGVIAKGRERGKMSLKRKMWDTAMGGNVTMQIWLSKQMLGYTEKQIHITQPVETFEVNQEERLARIKELQTKLKAIEGS